MPDFTLTNFVYVLFAGAVLCHSLLLTRISKESREKRGRLQHLRDSLDDLGEGVSLTSEDTEHSLRDRVAPHHFDAEAALELLGKLSAQPSGHRTVALTKLQNVQRDDTLLPSKIEVHATRSSALCDAYPILGISGTLLAIAGSIGWSGVSGEETSVVTGSILRAFSDALMTTLFGLALFMFFSVVLLPRTAGEVEDVKAICERASKWTSVLVKGLGAAKGEDGAADR